MAKIKVHELAKQIGADRKAVVDYLHTKGYDTMTAVSAVPDNEVDNIRSRFGGSSQSVSADGPAAAAASGTNENQDKGQAEAAPKKKGIVRVFRSQNASTQTSGRKKPETQEAPAAEETAAPAAPKSEDTALKAAPKSEVQEVPKAVKPEHAAESEAPKAEIRQESARPSNAQDGQRLQSDRRPREGSQERRPSGGQAQGRGEGRAQGDRRPREAGQERRPYGQDRDRRTSNNQGQGGQERRPYSQGQGGQERHPYSQGQGGQERRPYGQGQGGQERRSFGQNTGRDQGGQERRQFGQGQGIGRGTRPGGASRPAASADGALVHKTTRDYRKDGGKDYDRNKEERRENGKHSQYGSTSNKPNQGKKQFSRIPKALQQNKPKNEAPKEKEVVTEIKIPEKLTVRELAEAMKMQPAALVKDLFMKGMMVTVNHELPFEKAAEIAMEYDIIAEQEEKEDVIGELLAEAEENEDEMVARPPVVCVMGHVDHGKTSLLDAIRNTHVTDREAGGITQHIGAYMVTVNGQKITFLDTPGHEAFTAMRMRGANSTDIAVLVVAADDGVMPQTVEAINHAKAANVDIIVAINKIDKPGANIDRVKQELSEYGLLSEDWGGDTIFCPVSAKTHEGIENLLEMILLTAEVDELKANPNRKARGLVLEAKLDKGRGPVATILVQKGTLKQGDFIACGSASGKVRAMTDEKGRRLHKATPSMPVEIIGLSSVPDAGEVLVALDSDKEAKAFAQTFITEGKKNLIEETKTQMSLDDLFNQIKEGSLKELPIVIKADVQGSVEAVKQSLLKLSNEEVVVKVIHGGVGAITESDIALASASNAIVIGFNVRPDATAKAMAETQKVDVHLYNVIYEAIEDVTRALNGMRAAVYEEKILGHAEIRQVFKASGIGNIAGAYVRDGIFQRNCQIRVFRKDEKLYEGSLASLKRFKDDVKEVREGYECGLVFKDFGDFEVEDTVEAYTMVEVPRE
jgi:translation initiation factor IF-2